MEAKAESDDDLPPGIVLRQPTTISSQIGPSEILPSGSRARQQLLVGRFFDEVEAIFAEYDRGPSSASATTQTEVGGLTDFAIMLKALKSGLQSRLSLIDPPSLSKKALCRIEYDLLAGESPESPEVQSYLCQKLRALAVSVNEALAQPDHGHGIIPIRQWTPSARSYVCTPAAADQWVDITSLVIVSPDLGRIRATVEQASGLLRAPFVANSSTAYCNFGSVAAIQKLMSELGIPSLRKNDPECWVQARSQVLFARYLNHTDPIAASYCPPVLHVGARRPPAQTAIATNRLQQFHTLSAQWRQAQDQLR